MAPARGNVASKPTVYIETSVVSYLTARPSRDLIRAAHQAVTQLWWERRGRFSLYIADPVIQEACAGDGIAAARRLAALEPLALLDLTDEVLGLARRLIEGGGLPGKASVDATHVAIATVHGIEYLVTWNCRHIANAEMRSRIEDICRDAGYRPPVICTPDQLLGEEVQP